MTGFFSSAKREKLDIAKIKVVLVFLLYTEHIFLIRTSGLEAKAESVNVPLRT